MVENKNNSFKMPKLTPISIITKGEKKCTQFHRWFTFIRKWKVIENYSFVLSSGEEIIIPAEFIFDGASIPRPLWGLLSPTGLLLIPGLIHDFGYRYNYLWVVKVDSNKKKDVYKSFERHGQKDWDDLFYEVSMYVNGIDIINCLARLALKTFGGNAFQEHRNKKYKDIKPQIKNQIIHSQK